MADGIEFDFSELTRLAADIDEAADNVMPLIETALGVTSLRIKRGAARKVSRRRHFRQAAGAIDYDVRHFAGFGGASAESEIGFDKDREAGALGNLTEFGAPGSPNALTPGNELASTLHDEEPDFVRGVERAVDDALRKVGL